MVRGLVAGIVLLLLPSAVGAQQSRVYVGGAFALNTQPHSTTEPLGGTTWSGSILFGVNISPRVAVEVEPSFSGTYSWEYSYRPFPFTTVNVVASRRDTYLSFQVRAHLKDVEPVVGLAYVHGSLQRHATFVGGTPYFDDDGTDKGVAAVAGLDAPLRISDHFFVVPTFRFFAVMRPASITTIDLQEEQTSTGPFVFRYGLGARIAF